MVRKSTLTKKTATKTVGGIDKPNVNVTVRVEKITNGYLLSEEQCNNKTGKFTDKKSFSKTKPVIKVGPSI